MLALKCMNKTEVKMLNTFHNNKCIEIENRRQSDKPLINQAGVLVQKNNMGSVDKTADTNYRLKCIRKLGQSLIKPTRITSKSRQSLIKTIKHWCLH